MDFLAIYKFTNGDPSVAEQTVDALDLDDAAMIAIRFAEDHPDLFLVGVVQSEYAPAGLVDSFKGATPGFVVRDLEAYGRPIVGLYVDVDEDVIRYRRPSGSIGHAPADCVSIVKQTPNCMGCAEGTPNGHSIDCDYRQSKGWANQWDANSFRDPHGNGHRDPLLKGG